VVPASLGGQDTSARLISLPTWGTVSCGLISHGFTSTAWRWFRCWYAEDHGSPSVS
jgi:hypothetical protein